LLAGWQLFNGLQKQRWQAGCWLHQCVLRNSLGGSFRWFLCPGTTLYSSSKQIGFRRRSFRFRKRGTTAVYCCTLCRTTVVFGPAVLCIANSDASCISHGAQPLGLLDQLVYLLKLTCLHTVHSMTVGFGPAVHSPLRRYTTDSLWGGDCTAIPNGVSRNVAIDEIKWMAVDLCRVGVGCTVCVTLCTTGVAPMCSVK